MAAAKRTTRADRREDRDGREGLLRALAAQGFACRSMIEDLESVATMSATGTVSMAPYERAIARYEDTAIGLFALDADCDKAKAALREVEDLRRRMKVSWLSKVRKSAKKRISRLPVTSTRINKKGPAPQRPG